MPNEIDDARQEIAELGEEFDRILEEHAEWMGIDLSEVAGTCIYHAGDPCIPSDLCECAGMLDHCNLAFGGYVESPLTQGIVTIASKRTTNRSL